MKILRKDNYVDNVEKVSMSGLDVKKIMKNQTKHMHNSGNTLQIKKKNDSFSTFDDGLLYKFPLGQYEHLTYYCKTSTPTMDTCNVKLFKLQEMNTDKFEKDNHKWAPPLS